MINTYCTTIALEYSHFRKWFNVYFWQDSLVGEIENQGAWIPITSPSQNIASFPDLELNNQETVFLAHWHRTHQVISSDDKFERSINNITWTWDRTLEEIDIPGSGPPKVMTVQPSGLSAPRAKPGLLPLADFLLKPATRLKQSLPKFEGLRSLRL